jgi:hypothetical protein
MKYYRICTDDVRYPDRWFLDEPQSADGDEIDPREFTYGKPYFGPLPATVPMQPGIRVAFHLAAFDMPVVTSEVAEMLERVEPEVIERYPIIVDGDIRGYEIINVVATAACVDEQKSRIMWWTEEDNRPDRLGTYRDISMMTLDPSRTEGHHIFRIRNWEIALIVSERVSQTLEQLDDLGIIFKPVT